MVFDILTSKDVGGQFAPKFVVFTILIFKMLWDYFAWLTFYYFPIWFYTILNLFIQI